MQNAFICNERGLCYNSLRTSLSKKRYSSVSPQFLYFQNKNQLLV